MTALLERLLLAMAQRAIERAANYIERRAEARRTEVATQRIRAALLSIADSAAKLEKYTK